MSEVSMSLIGHLEELRKIIIRIIIAVVLGSVVSYSLFHKTVLHFIELPILDKEIQLVTLTVTEAFLTRMKVSILTGVVLTIPYTAWKIWGFILPALYAHEKKYVYIMTPFTAILFIGGIVFGYYAVLPVALMFFIGQGGELTPMLSFARYISFVLGFLFPFGLIFQLPVAVLFLVKIGAVDYKFFQKNRKYAILIIFILAALLTPADVISQVLMAAPLLVLYEISIILSWFVRKKVKKEDEETNDSQEIV